MKATLRALRLVAVKELEEAGRSRWVWVMAALLVALPLLVSALGLGLGGGLKVEGFGRTTASLVNLSIYLMPLFGLQLAQGSIVGEAERGTLALLAAQPIDRRVVVVGKFLGLAALFALLAGGSFAVSGTFIGVRAGVEHVGDYVAFTAGAIWLGCCFIAIGLWLSAVARDRAQALAGAMGTWFFFAVVLDLLLLAGFVALSKALVAPDYAPTTELLHRELAQGITGDEARIPWLSGLVLVNPTGVFRIWTVLRTPALRGVMSMTRSLPAWLDQAGTLLVAAAVWIMVPLALAARRFRRAEL